MVKCRGYRLLLQQALLKPFDFSIKKKKKKRKERRQTAALGVALAGRHSQEACAISCLFLPGWDCVGKLYWFRDVAIGSPLPGLVASEVMD